MLYIMVFVGLGGCASSSGPTSAVSEYRQALEKRDYSAAYQMMSERFRARHSKKEFIRTLKANPREVAHTVRQMKKIGDSAEIGAELRYGLSESLRLVWRKGRWQIETDPTAYYSQASPRDALRSFVRAYQLKRWDILLRFVPDDYRKRMNVTLLRKQFEGSGHEDIVGMMGILAASLDRPIEDKGDEARMKYGDRSEVQFVFEGGSWKIRDLK